MHTFGQPETALDELNERISMLAHRIADYHKEHVHDAQLAVDRAKLERDDDATLLEGWRGIRRQLKTED